MKKDEIIEEDFEIIEVEDELMQETEYPEDTRTYVTMDFFGKTLYHAYNVLTEDDRKGLLEEIDDELESNIDNKDGSIDSTNGLSTRKIKNRECWLNFFKKVKMHMYNYAEITNDPQIKNLKISSYWCKRMKDVSDEDYAEGMYINYGNLHSHINHDLGIIYYLQNSSRIYGTLIESAGREIIVPGDENSMVIHHSSMNHAAVLPPPAISKDYPRYVLVVDFKYPHKFV
jgi:hypothetical protein